MGNFKEINGVLTHREDVTVSPESALGIANVGALVFSLPFYLITGDPSALAVGAGAFALANATAIGFKVRGKTAYNYQHKIAERIKRVRFLQFSVDYDRSYEAKVDSFTKKLTTLESSNGKDVSGFNKAVDQKIELSSIPVAVNKKRRCTAGHSSLRMCFQYHNNGDIGNLLKVSEAENADYFIKAFTVVENGKFYLDQEIIPTEKRLWVEAYETALSLHKVQLCKDEKCGKVDGNQEEELIYLSDIFDQGITELKNGAKIAGKALRDFFF